MKKPIIPDHLAECIIDALMDEYSEGYNDGCNVDTTAKTCREFFVKYVHSCIKEDAQHEFLKTGSSHWLDFKAGWFAREGALR
jgi:hypothetical protein